MPVAVQKRVMFAPGTLDNSPHRDGSSLIFQAVVPRRKTDSFGRDTTSRSNFMFSAMLFPTGVRAPALEELQRRCDHVSSPRSIRHPSQRVLPADDWSDGSPRVLSLEKRKENTPDSTWSVSRESSKVSVSSLRSYNWAPLESPRDIRDPMYMNTYCSNERPLRFKESTLPRIIKNRPWSVGESNPSKRFVRVDPERKSREERDRKLQVRPRRRTDAFYSPRDNSDTGQYFEVKRVSADQRNKLRGPDGCLYSQVRQCIRLMKNQEHDRKIDRPMKAEVGRYRPFSTTRIRTPCLSPRPPPLFREQGSADTYRQYAMTKTLQSQMSVPKSAGTISSGTAARNNTVASSYHDTESRIVQNVADSNMPAIDIKSDYGGSEDSDTSDENRRQTNLAIGLEIRSATLAQPILFKSKTSDSEVDTPFLATSPRRWTTNSSQKEISSKKELALTKHREKSKHSEKFASGEGSRVALATRPTLEPVAIQLDDSGNPTIWQDTAADDDDETDPEMIIIPAAMTSMSIEDTEGTDTHDEGY